MDTTYCIIGTPNSQDMEIMQHILDASPLWRRVDPEKETPSLAIIYEMSALSRNLYEKCNFILVRNIILDELRIYSGAHKTIVSDSFGWMFLINPKTFYWQDLKLSRNTAYRTDVEGKQVLNFACDIHETPLDAAKRFGKNLIDVLIAEPEKSL